MYLCKKTNKTKHTYTVPTIDDLAGTSHIDPEVARIAAKVIAEREASAAAEAGNSGAASPSPTATPPPIGKSAAGAYAPGSRPPQA